MVRRVGAVFGVLALGGAGAAVWLAHRYDLGVAQTVVALVTASAGLYLSWASYRADRRAENRETTLEEVASALAREVSRQWERELNVRQVHHPGPLPVAWTAADPTLVHDWESICALASSWPDHSPEATHSWAQGPQDLASSGPQVDASLVLCVPTRRLVLLGEPGAGKTVLLTRLVLSLVRHHEVTGKVPVLFSLSSWDPHLEDLHAWMTRRMERDYRNLSLLAPAHGASSRASALLSEGMVFPILDGFDELPGNIRTQAMDALNDWLLMGQPVVLSSRPEEFHEAVTTNGARLSGAAGIELLPLDPQDIERHLLRGARGDTDLAHRRWALVLGELTTGSVTARCLARPLMLFLVGALYNAPGNAGENPNPDELCDVGRFPDLPALERHLQTAFVPTVYRSPARDAEAGPWTPEQALRTLSLWARALAERGSHDLAWWELPRLMPAPVRAMGLVVTFVLLGPLAGIPVAWAVRSAGESDTAGLLAGLGAGGLMACVALLVLVEDWFEVQDQPRTPTFRQRWSWSLPGTVLGVAAGWACWVTFGPAVGVLAGIVVGFVESLLSGLKATSIEGYATADSPVLFRRDRREFFTTLVGVGCVVGGSTGVLSGAACRVPSAVVLGLSTGLATGTVAALHQTCWGQYALGCRLLALMYGLPGDMMTFIDRAHARYGVLRRVGAVYQFRHLELERALAQADDPVRDAAPATTGGTV